MNKLIKHTLEGLGILMLLTALGIVLVTRYRNPDMSETRLFMCFWPFYILVVVLCLVAFWIFEMALKDASR